MLMSLLGHYNNFFFAAHLVDIAMGVKTLRTILSSVTHNGKQVTLLLKIRNRAFSWPVLFFCFFTLDPLFSSLSLQLVMTVGLLAVVVYLYTVVAFNFFRKFYNMSEDEDEPDMKCDDMMTVSEGQPPHKKQQSKKTHFRTHPAWFFGGRLYYELWCYLNWPLTLPPPAVLPVPHVRWCASWRWHRRWNWGPSWWWIRALPRCLWHYILLLRYCHPAGYHPG